MILIGAAAMLGIMLPTCAMIIWLEPQLCDKLAALLTKRSRAKRASSALYKSIYNN